MITIEEGAKMLAYIKSNKNYPVSTKNLRRVYRFKKNAINGFLSNQSEIEYLNDGSCVGSGKNKLTLWRVRNTDGKPRMKIQLINTSSL